MGLNPTKVHIETIRKKIQEKIMVNQFITEKNFEKIAKQIVK
jgi:hypothetical protein